MKVKNVSKLKFPCRVKTCHNKWHKTATCPNAAHRPAPHKNINNLRAQGNNVISLDKFREQKKTAVKVKEEHPSELFRKLLSSPFKTVTKEILRGDEKLVAEFKKDKHGRWMLSRKATTILTTSRTETRNPQDMRSVWEVVDEAGGNVSAMLNHPSIRTSIPHAVNKITLRVTRKTSELKFHRITQP